jgi:hypothetical protein
MTLAKVLEAADAKDVQALLQEMGGDALLDAYVASTRDPSAENLKRLVGSLTKLEAYAFANLQRQQDALLSSEGAPASNVESWDLHLQRSAELSGEVIPRSMYGSPNEAPHGFSNETGLNACASALRVRGGSVVGVLSEAIEVGAAIEAKWIIALDADPRAKQFVQTLNAMLLSLHSLARQHGWNDAYTANELRQRIAGDVPVSVTAREMQSTGLWTELSPSMLEERVLQVRVSFFEAVGDIPGAPLNWLTCPQAPSRVAHLIRLAQEGRLLTVTAACGHRQTLSRVAALLERNEAPVTAVCLSNIFDYTALVSDVAEAFRQLPLAPNSVLISTHINDWNLNREEGAELVSNLGSWWEPGVQPAPAWLETDGAGDLLDRSIWAQAMNREQFWLRCLHRLTPERSWLTIDDAMKIGRVLGKSEEALSAWRDATPSSHSNLVFEHSLLALGVPSSSRECREWLTLLNEVFGSA